MTKFAAQTAVEDGVHVVTLAGELDQATVPDLKAKLDPVTAEAEALLIDLERCDFIDSSGLRVVVGETYPLSEVRRAHEDLQGRRTSGKLLLDPSR